MTEVSKRIKVENCPIVVGDFVKIDPDDFESYADTFFVRLTRTIQKVLNSANTDDENFIEVDKDTFDSWKPYLDDEYVVQEIFFNPDGIRKDHQFIGPEGYLLLLKNANPTRNDLILIPDWMCTKRK